MKNKEYIDISKAFSSSLVEKVGASTTFNSFVPINKIAELKGLKSNRSLRLAIQKGKFNSARSKPLGWVCRETCYCDMNLIKQACKGKQKTSCGYRWEFVKEESN